MDAFARIAGAVPADPGVAHFGDPLREQRALAAGDAIAPLGDREVVSVAGEDRLSWLDSITSQAVAALEPGQSTELLVLDPQGRIEHAAAVIDDGSTAWLIADAGDAEPLAAWLDRMRFRARAEVALHPELSVVGGVAGGRAERALAAAAHRPNGTPLLWRDPWSGVSGGGWQYAAVDPHPGAERPWIEAIVTAAAAESLAAAVPGADPGADPAAPLDPVAGAADPAAPGADPAPAPAASLDPAAGAAGGAADPAAAISVAGLLAAEALRIAAWRPRWRAEVDERAIPHETDWLRSAVHLGKGCYRGQETVAKVHNLGHPPRRLAMLHLDGSESVLPAHGDAVFAGDVQAGRVTSAALHHELGPIALAVLSRRTPPDAELVVEHDGSRIAAAQQVVVPADAGATAEVPRLTRLSRRPSATPPARS